jgi:hypothetical protein
MPITEGFNMLIGLVIPAQAGIQKPRHMNSGLRRNDD